MPIMLQKTGLTVENMLTLAQNNSMWIKTTHHGCLPMQARMSPSTERICPFTKSDAAEAGKTAGPLRSSTLPHRAAGVFAMINWSKGSRDPPGYFSRNSAVWGVSIYP
jgi:hypothetical protein